MTHCSKNLLKKTKKKKKKPNPKHKQTKNPYPKEVNLTKHHSSSFRRTIEQFSSKFFSTKQLHLRWILEQIKKNNHDRAWNTQPSLLARRKHCVCFCQTLREIVQPLIWISFSPLGIRGQMWCFLLHWLFGPEHRSCALSYFFFTHSVDKTYPTATLNIENAVNSPRKCNDFLLLLLSRQK